MGQSSSKADAMSLPAVSIPRIGAEAPQTSEAASKPKPCCVCKDEKVRRDECMLFSNTADPAKECQSTIDQYRSCMEGFGFKV